MALIDQLKEKQIIAMKAKDKVTLGTIRLVMSEVKQREVDNKITLSDNDILEVLTKMMKQRRDSLAQYLTANRQDLADVEQAEIFVIQNKFIISKSTPVTDRWFCPFGAAQTVQHISNEREIQRHRKRHQHPNEKEQHCGRLE